MDRVYDFTPKDAAPPRHHWLLPNRLWALLVGPSGSGKTNLLINLLLTPSGIGWDSVNLVGPGLEEQPIYQPLREFGEGVVETEIARLADAADAEGREPSEAELATIEDPVTFIPDVADAPTPEDIDPEPRNTIVFVTRCSRTRKRLKSCSVEGVTKELTRFICFKNTQPSRNVSATTQTSSFSSTGSTGTQCERSTVSGAQGTCLSPSFNVSSPRPRANLIASRSSIFRLGPTQASSAPVLDSSRFQ